MTDASDLRIESIADHTPHYARTLRTWRENLAERRHDAHALGYGEPLLRLWDFYLCYCEAGFCEHRTGLVHMHLVKPEWRADSEGKVSA